MNRKLRSIVSAGACAGLFGLSALATPVAIGAPNAHANSHATSGGNGNGGGNSGSNGNGKAGGNGNGSAVHQFALASGQKQGDISSSLKSWNSLNANPHAFLNNLDNPNSLLGKEAKYVCDNVASQTALTSFSNAGGDPLNPPTQPEVDAANAYLNALAALANSDSTQTDIDAANAVIAANSALEVPLTPDSANTIITQFNDWQAYQGAETSAQDSFLAASVSYKGATYDANMSALRATVDGVVAQKGLGSSGMCPAPTVASN